MTSPAGAASRTLAFLFSDLRGYTDYIERHGDAAAAELVRGYRAIVRDAVSRHGGQEITTEGDSFFVVFESIAAAVRCGADILNGAGAHEPPILLGVGVHAGEAVASEVGYVAGPVNIAARLCAVAKAGDLMVTDAVRALTRTAVEARFQSVGLRRLKGVEEPTMLWRVEVPGAARSPDHGVPPGGLVLGVTAASVVALIQLAFQTYLMITDVPAPFFHARWSQIMPGYLNPWLALLGLIYVASDLIVVFAFVLRSQAAARITTRVLITLCAVTVIMMPPWSYGIASISMGSVGAFFLYVFAGLMTVNCAVFSYGIYRRRAWAVGLGYAVCALFIIDVFTLPVGIAGIWSLATRRENALY